MMIVTMLVVLMSFLPVKWQVDNYEQCAIDKYVTERRLPRFLPPLPFPQEEHAAAVELPLLLRVIVGAVAADEFTTVSNKSLTLNDPTGAAKVVVVVVMLIVMLVRLVIITLSTVSAAAKITPASTTFATSTPMLTSFPVKHSKTFINSHEILLPASSASPMLL